MQTIPAFGFLAHSTHLLVRAQWPIRPVFERHGPSRPDGLMGGTHGHRDLAANLL